MSGNCCVGCIFLLVPGIGAEAADLKGLSAFGMQSVLEDLGPPFERATGHQLAVAFATGGGAVKRVQGGEVAGLEIVGPLPGDLQHTVVFSAAIMAGPKAAAVKALVDFLRTPESAPVIQAKGMEPATP
jgi:ABC-type molybdate transport system substrate-binding protein